MRKPSISFWILVAVFLLGASYEGGIMILNGGANSYGDMTIKTGDLVVDTGDVTSTAGAVSAGTTVTAGTGITSTTGNIAASAGAVSANTTMTAGTGITATTGNIAASAGAVSANTTVTAGTGISATTGNIQAVAGDFIVDGGEIGVTGDLDLLTLASESLTINGNTTLTNGGGDTNSYKLLIQAHMTAGDETQTSSLRTAWGLDPYMIIATPNATGVETDVVHLDTNSLRFANDNSVDIGAVGANRPKDLFLSGNVKSGGDLIVDGGEIGIAADLDLLALASAALIVNGSLTLGDSVYEDLRVSLTADTSPPASGAPDLAAFHGGIFAHLFDDAAEESLHIATQLPHGYKYLTDINIHIHWSPTSADTGTVRWCLEWSIAEEDGVFGGPTTDCGTQVGSGVAKTHQFLNIGTIDGSAINTLSAVIIGRVYRDADGADTYADDAAGLELDFHYQVDTMGSAGVDTK